MKKLLPFLGISAITVLLVEAMLWIFLPQGWEPKIDIPYWQDIPGLKKDIRFEKNALGLRTLTVNQKAKPENTIRVLCVGASTTEQGTHNTEDMWAMELERLLQEAMPQDGPKVEVAAYAKGGAKMTETMQWARRHLMELEPDVVVTLFGINSLVTDDTFLARGDFDTLYRPWIESEPAFFPDKAAAFSQIARYTRNIKANALRMRMKEETKGLNFDVMGVASFRQNYWQTPLITDAEATRVPSRFFRESTEYFVAWLQSQGVRPVVLGQPLLLHSGLNYVESGEGQVRFTGLPPTATQSEVDEVKQALASIWFVINRGDERGMERYLPGTMRSEMTRFNQEQRDAALALGAAYVPLDEALAPTTENFFDDCHFTDLGSDRLAEAIFPTVLKEVQSAASDQ